MATFPALYGLVRKTLIGKYVKLTPKLFFLYLIEIYRARQII